MIGIENVGFSQEKRDVSNLDRHQPRTRDEKYLQKKINRNFYAQRKAAWEC